MLATVLERTREIGVRRAVGAKKKDILGQFIIEAVVLSISGGLIGIFLGFVMTKVIAIYADWPTIVSYWAIVLSFGVSVAVGLVFGIFPAKKAAEVDPIESLRYE
ncbi:MAG: FtsX-like permease family protein, partial [bacterium]|nr:FtsX-like permease family protein [bacterium]